MKHLGDITKIHGNQVPQVNFIVGGSPCQDLSVAGKRAGLDGERSGLFMEQIRITKEMRNASNDDRRVVRYAMWENVPGCFTSGNPKGEDFRCVLEEFVRVAREGITIPTPPKGKWRTSGAIIWDGGSLAWRVMDAQFWGVPQRRRRVCLLVDYGGYTAPDILFESVECGGSTKHTDGDKTFGNIRKESRQEVQPFAESVCGNPDEGKQERETTPAGVRGGTQEPNAITLQLRGGGNRE